MKMDSTHITEKGRETAKGLEGAVLTSPSKLNLKYSEQGTVCRTLQHSG